MTVKLVNFLKNSDVGNLPSLPPKIALNAQTCYPNHHQQQEQHYTEDEDDMNTASIMTSRDHPFNNSQRPLLADRNPEFLNKTNTNSSLQQYRTPQKHQHQEYKSYIPSYVQKQKRDSAKGLHGFNDFDILSQQYTHLQSPHIGYPYGSPPSPNSSSKDFVFDTFTTQVQQKYRTIAQHSYANIDNYATDDPSHQNDISEVDGDDNANCNVDPTNTIVTQGYIGNPSRFEDDFCCRRNIEFSKQHVDGISNNGPFIFGMPAEQQGGLSGIPTGGFTNSSNTVIAIGDISKTSTLSEPATLLSNTGSSSTSYCSSNIKSTKFLLRKHKSKKNIKDKQCESNAAEKPTIKCVVVGDGAVGKTNLILSYLENRFNSEHIPTASDIYNADVMVNDSPVHLTLCDTAGQDTLNPLRELCYPESDVFLLCFSVANPETFHAIKTKWAPKFANAKAALILVGTQADLRKNFSVLNKLKTNGEKPISYADAWDLAKTIGGKYIETSSATQDKVKEVFDTAIWEALVTKKLPSSTPLWKKIFCLA